MSRVRYNRNERIKTRIFLNSLGEFLMLGKTDVLPSVNTKEFCTSRIKPVVKITRRSKDKDAMRNDVSELRIKILEGGKVEVTLKENKRELSVELRFDELVYLQTAIQVEVCADV